MYESMYQDAKSNAPLIIGGIAVITLVSFIFLKPLISGVGSIASGGGGVLDSLAHGIRQSVDDTSSAAKAVGHGAEKVGKTLYDGAHKAVCLGGLLC